MKIIKPSNHTQLDLITAAALLTVFLFQAPAFSGPQKADTGKMLREGKKVFLAQCINCHGPKGDGNGPASPALNPKPANFIKGKFKFGNSAPLLFKTISAGISGSAMPPWKGTLTDEQINNVIVYIKSLKK
jgi:mono/diheme cytochrome c family protein